MIHDIKILPQYLIHIVEGKKLFEVRKNDRDYQVGDTIHFLPLESSEYKPYALGFGGQHFDITYVHTGLGLQEGYAVLGIKMHIEAEIRKDK